MALTDVEWARACARLLEFANILRFWGQGAAMNGQEIDKAPSGVPNVTTAEGPGGILPDAMSAGLPSQARDFGDGEFVGITQNALQRSW